MSERRAAPRGISLWLQLRASDERRLEGVQDRLRQRFGGPVFPPHLTLLGERAEPLADLVARMEGAAEGRCAIDLAVAGVDSREPPFRALALDLLPHAGLAALRAALGAGLPGVHRPWWPHLSLIYARLDAEAAAEARRHARTLCPQGLTADRLVAWRTEGAVEAWHPLAEVALGR